MTEEPEDRVVQALAFDDQVRVLAATTTGLVREGVTVQQTAAPAGILFGRLLTGTALLAASRKGLTRLTLQTRSEGPLPWMIARADAEGNVYGTLAPLGEIPVPDPEHPPDIADLIGSEGQLMVTRESLAGDRWTGTVPLATGGVGEDIAAWLLQSEQIRSAIGVGVLLDDGAQVQAAGGFLIQILGGLAADALEEIEARLARITELARDIDGGQRPEELLHRLCGPSHRILESNPLRYHCPHDRDYYRGRLASLGPDELRSLFDEEETLVIRCEFSGRTFHFGRGDFEGT